MAYMSQQRKAEINSELKKVIPKDWKWSLAVRNHSTIVLTIQSAPVDLLGEFKRSAYGRGYACTYAKINEYDLARQFSESLPIMQQILECMNKGNWDRSDPQTDYFDVGYYVDVQLGRWDRPFIVTEVKGKP